MGRKYPMGVFIIVSKEKSVKENHKDMEGEQWDELFRK